MACRWAHVLRGVDADTLARADEIEARKARAREAVAQCLADEAALFMDLYRSQEWTADQMIQAISSGMDREVKYRLPDPLPRQRRSTRNSRA